MKNKLFSFLLVFILIALMLLITACNNNTNQEKAITEIESTAYKIIVETTIEEKSTNFEEYFFENLEDIRSRYSEYFVAGMTNPNGTLISSMYEIMDLVKERMEQENN